MSRNWNRNGQIQQVDPRNAARGAAPSNAPVEPDRVRWQPIFPEPEPEVLQEIYPVPQPSRPSLMPRIVALVLACIALGLCVRFVHQVCVFFSMIEKLGGGGTQQEALMGLCVFGLALVAMLAALKIVLNAQEGRR